MSRPQSTHEEAADLRHDASGDHGHLLRADGPRDLAVSPGDGEGEDVAPAARAALSSLKDVRPFGEIVEDDGDLWRGDFPFAALLHDLSLLVDDLPELAHGELLEDQGLAVLVAELLDELDEGLVLLVQARRGREEEDARKERLSRFRDVEFAEDVEELHRLPSAGGGNEAEGRRQAREGLSVLAVDPFRGAAVNGDLSIRHLSVVARRKTDS